MKPRDVLALVVGALAGATVSYFVAELVRGPSGRVWFVGQPGNLEARVDAAGRRALMERFPVLSLRSDGGAQLQSGALGVVDLIPIGNRFRVLVSDRPDLGRHLAEDLVALRVLVEGPT